MCAGAGGVGEGGGGRWGGGEGAGPVACPHTQHLHPALPALPALHAASPLDRLVSYTQHPCDEFSTGEVRVQRHDLCCNNVHAHAFMQLTRCDKALPAALSPGPR
jgi:hypothetical protein